MTNDNNNDEVNWGAPAVPPGTDKAKADETPAVDPSWPAPTVDPTDHLASGYASGWKGFEEVDPPTPSAPASDPYPSSYSNYSPSTPQEPVWPTPPPQENWASPTVPPPGYSMPPGGYLPPPPGPHYPMGYGAPSRSVHPMAIPALVLGILGIMCCGITGPVALGLGLYGLNEQKNNPEKYDPNNIILVSGTILGGMSTLIFVGSFITGYGFF